MCKQSVIVGYAKSTIVVSTAAIKVPNDKTRSTIFWFIVNNVKEVNLRLTYNSVSYYYYFTVKKDKPLKEH